MLEGCLEGVGDCGGVGVVGRLSGVCGNTIWSV